MFLKNSLFQFYFHFNFLKLFSLLKHWAVIIDSEHVMIFSHPVGHLFSCLIVYFDSQRVPLLMKPSRPTFSLGTSAFDILLVSFCLLDIVKTKSTICFMILALILKFRHCLSFYM